MLPRRASIWPVEHTTYTAAAVILAVDALVRRRTPGLRASCAGHLAGAALRASSPSSAAARRAVSRASRRRRRLTYGVSTRIEPSASASVEGAARQRPQVDVVRRLAAVRGSREDVVDDERAAALRPSGAQPV